MIYVVRFKGIGLALVGTARWVKESREFMARTGRTADTFRGATCDRMLVGTEVDAARVRDHFTPEVVLIRDQHAWVAAAGIDLIPVTPEFDRWVSENGEPWDGRENEALGVKGLPKPRHDPPPAKLGTLADRVRRR